MEIYAKHNKYKEEFSLISRIFDNRVIAQLNDLVKVVNGYNHSKSCQKGSMGCRFSFPRLPSDETLIAHPIPDEELESQDPVVKD